MARLEELNKIVGRELGGLSADNALLAKIRIHAAEEPRPAGRFRKALPVLVSAAAAACALLIFALVPVNRPAVREDSLISTRSAGDALSLAAEPVVTEMPAGTITLSAGHSMGSTGLFSPDEMITVKGAAYRMLTEPENVPEALLGEALGTVKEFNMEPALGTARIVSNCVSCGETVYPVRDMEGALICASVNGEKRLFQRVSYAGTAAIGAEGLADVLCKADDAAWIRLEDGTSVTDGASELLALLLDNADCESTAMNGGASLQIGLKNGLVLQLFTADDCVSACGTWCCPEFFDALRMASAE